MEFITDTGPIRHINTNDVKLSEAEIQECIVQGLKNAFKLTSNPCITVIQLELFRAVKMASNKPKIQ